jgi:hypothetical protein
MAAYRGLPIDQYSASASGNLSLKPERIVVICIVQGHGERKNKREKIYPEDGGDIFPRNFGTTYKTTRRHNPEVTLML